MANTDFPNPFNHDYTSREPLLKGLDPILAARYSPRAFKPVSLDDETVHCLFDAARQAPSCFNEQPWRFYCSNNENFDDYLALLVPANAEWAKNASLLTFVAAEKSFKRNGNTNRHSWFDSGAAWFALAYQARTMGLYTHAMAGIHYDKIPGALNMPDSQEVICAIAIGVINEDAAIGEEISPRKSLDDILIR